MAWKPLGWTAAAYAEIEAFPSAVLAHHYPNTPNLGDMTAYDTWNLGSIDLLVGGTPCQDFSNAGLRDGLDGDRGQLTMCFSRIAYRFRPRWLLWENVPGAFTTRAGRDFGSVLACFAGYPDGTLFAPPTDGWGNSGIIAPATPDSYGLAWRVLDAQYAGVPQRRARIFIVGYLGDWRPAAAALFDTTCLRWDSPPRRRQGESVTGTLSARSKGGGGLGTDFECQGGVVPTLDASYARLQGCSGQDLNHGHGHLIPAMAFGGNNTKGPINVSAALLGGGKIDFESETFIVPFDTTQITSKANYSNPKHGDPCHPLVAHGHAPAIAYRTAGDGAVFEEGDHTAPLTRQTDPNAHIVAIPILEAGARTGKSTTDPRAGIGIGEDGDPMFTLQASKQHAVMAFQPRFVRNGRGAPDTIASALTAHAGETGKGDSAQCIAYGYSVRRLTPVECERLQGFPDNFTLIPGKHRPRKPMDLAQTIAYLIDMGVDEAEATRLANCPDGPRYEALGNSQAVPVMRWLGERIQAVDNLKKGGV